MNKTEKFHLLQNFNSWAGEVIRIVITDTKDGHRVICWSLLYYGVDTPGPNKAVSSLRTKPKTPHLTVLLNLPHPRLQLALNKHLLSKELKKLA